MTQTKPIKNYAAYFRTLNTLFYAILTGAVLFWLIVFVFLRPSLQTGFSFLVKIYLFVIAVETPAFIILQRKMLDAVRSEKTLRGKLSRYQTLFLVRMAMLEGLILFGIMVGMIEGNVWMKWITLGLIFLMALLRPTTDKIANELELNGQEMRYLDTPELEIPEE